MPGHRPPPRAGSSRHGDREGEPAVSAISLGRVTTLLLLGRAVGYGFGLVNSVIVARSLGVEMLGVYAYALGLTALFGIVPNMGISTLVTRTIAEAPGSGAGILRAAVEAQALLAAGVLVAIPAFAAALPGQPAPLGYVILAAAQLAVGTLSWPYLAVLGGHARYDLLAAAELAAATAGTAALLLAAALGGALPAILWAHVAAAALAVVVARRIARPLIAGDPQAGPALGALFRRAAPFGAIGIVQSLYTRLDVVLLGQLAPALALGLYSAAYKPTNLLVYFGAAVAGTLLPLMARGPWLGAPLAFERALRALAASAPAMALALTGLGDLLLSTLYGVEFSPAAPVLAILAWSAAANWLYAPLAVALQARGEARAWLASLAVGVVLNAAANAWAIPRWQALGAAGATLFSESVLVGLAAVLVRRRLRIGLPLRVVLAPGIGAAAGLGSLWLLGGVDPRWATAAGLAVYAGILVLFRTVTTEDLGLVLGWMRQAALGTGRA
jgi:O-antigen/teichoic acid export membrane protein